MKQLPHLETTPHLLRAAPPNVEPRDIGSVINELSAHINPAFTHRLRAHDFGTYELRALEAYQQGHDDLVNAPKDFVPKLKLANKQRIHHYAQNTASKNKLSFNELNIPSTRYENSFSTPPELLKTANELEIAFVETIHDAFIQQQLITPQYSLATLESDPNPVLKQALPDTQKYLTYHLLQLDADYVTAHVLQDTYNKQRAQRSRKSRNPLTLLQRWRSRDSFTWLERTSELYGPADDLRENADKQFSLLQRVARDIYRN